MNNYQWLEKVETIIAALSVECGSVEELIARCEQYSEEEYSIDNNGDTLVTVIHPIHITYPDVFASTYC